MVEYLQITFMKKVLSTFYSLTDGILNFRRKVPKWRCLYDVSLLPGCHICCSKAPRTFEAGEWSWHWQVNGSQSCYSMNFSVFDYFCAVCLQSRDNIISEKRNLQVNLTNILYINNHLQLFKHTSKAGSVSIIWCKGRNVPTQMGPLQRHRMQC